MRASCGPSRSAPPVRPSRLTPIILLSAASRELDSTLERLKALAGGWQIRRRWRMASLERHLDVDWANVARAAKRRPTEGACPSAWVGVREGAYRQRCEVVSTQHCVSDGFGVGGAFCRRLRRNERSGAPHERAMWAGKEVVKKEFKKHKESEREGPRGNASRRQAAGHESPGSRTRQPGARSATRPSEGP